MHTASLVIMGYDDSSASSSSTAVDDEETRPRATDDESIPLSAVESGQVAQETKTGQNVRRRRLSLSEAREQRKAKEEENKGRREVPVAVVEQRVSNLAQGCLCAWISVKLFDYPNLRSCFDDETVRACARSNSERCTRRTFRTYPQGSFSLRN